VTDKKYQATYVENSTIGVAYLVPRNLSTQKKVWLHPEIFAALNALHQHDLLNSSNEFLRTGELFDNKEIDSIFVIDLLGDNQDAVLR